MSDLSTHAGKLWLSARLDCSLTGKMCNSDMPIETLKHTSYCTYISSKYWWWDLSTKILNTIQKWRRTRNEIRIGFQINIDSLTSEWEKVRLRWKTCRLNLRITAAGWLDFRIQTHTRGYSHKISNCSEPKSLSAVAQMLLSHLILLTLPYYLLALFYLFICFICLIFFVIGPFLWIAAT